MSGVDDPIVAAQREAALVYREYQQRLLGEERLDFDDTIYYTVQLLINQPSVAARQSQRFAHLMVDEFQDTNFGQSRLLELFAGQRCGLLLAGLRSGGLLLCRLPLCSLLLRPADAAEHGTAECRHYYARVLHHTAPPELWT